MDKITYKELVNLINHEHEVFKTIEDELENVDDHGDVTHYLVFYNSPTDEHWMVDYIREKEWGIMKQDTYDCERVYPHIVQKTVWRSTP